MQITTLTASELAEKTQKHDTLQLIDTLPEDHFQKVHLPGSRNACVYQVTFLEEVRAIIKNEETEIIVYGAGLRSRDAQVAAEKLQRAGYRRVSVLAGGIAAWRAAGLPLEGLSPNEAIDPATILVLSPGSYQLDEERSVVDWTGRNRTTSHNGSLFFHSGRIDAAERGFTGQLTVDMARIINHNLAGNPLQQVLIDHLQSDDFFLVSEFPTTVLTIRQAALRPEPFLTSTNCDISAELMVRGISRPLNFAATVTTELDTLLLEAHFAIDRTNWGIIYGSARFFEYLGMHQVFDEISLCLRLVLVRTNS